MANPSSNPPSVTLQQAADRARVSLRTIYKRIGDGTLDTVRRGVSRRVVTASLESWLTFRKDRKVYGEETE